MLHKHNWQLKDKTKDYMTERGKIVCHGEIYECKKCFKSLTFDPTAIYLSVYGLLYNRQKKPLRLPKWGW